MSRSTVSATPGVDDFRALAQSSPWRFATMHFTHQRRRTTGSPVGGMVEAWLDRGAHRVTVRSPSGVEVAEGAPYGMSSIGTPPSSRRSLEPTLRSDGLVADRPEGWHLQYGDPMWRDYQWTAMLDPVELSHGVQIEDVTATMLRGRLTWSAHCRPLPGEGEDWQGGYDPRCGCCPLLDSAASRLPEYGPDDARLKVDDLPRAYLVQLDVQTAVAVQIDAMDGWGGVVLSNEIHDVDRPLAPPAH
jgi:hypothetical protein